MKRTVTAIVALFLLAAVYVSIPKKTVIQTEELVHVEQPLPAEICELEVKEEAQQPRLTSHSTDEQLPQEINRMSALFQPYSLLQPLVETITYVSNVSWLEGRPAYLGDYAAHYKTSKHFISKSLHGNYLCDVVSKGARFNVLRTDKPLEFHLVLDLSRLKMWAYCYDGSCDKRYLLKSYPACVGQLSSESSSGCLTPTGTFLLGEEIAVYKEGIMGKRHGEPIEMVTVFGKRWIPLVREIADCSGPCRGLGIHGMPWKRDSESGQLLEVREHIGQYDSEGCIRLLTEDIEELFSVIVSRPTYIHIVKDFVDAKLPGQEA